MMGNGCSRLQNSCALALILAAFTLLAMAEPSLSDGSAAGTVSVSTTIKRAGESCETGATAKCKVGQLCFANITISGPAAKTLYDALRIHGIKSEDCCGEYVGTQTDSMRCVGVDGSYTCFIGYDGPSNKISSPQSCQPE
jgi:hypothetical protein